MAFIRTMRVPRHCRHGHFVPGGLACAAARPLTLSSAALRLDFPLALEKTPEDTGPGVAMDARAASSECRA